MKRDKNVIPSFRDLTPQQVFDMAFNHVKQTKTQCMIDGACSYNGIGCAAAPFLTKDARENLHASWDVLVGKGLVPPENGGLIDKIQSCHDEWWPETGVPFYENFVNSMKSVAESFNLEMREP